MIPRFGVFLSAQHPPEMPASQIVRGRCERVRLARQLGFDDVAAGQHFLAQRYQMLKLVPLLSRIAAEAGEPLNTGSGPHGAGLTPALRTCPRACVRSTKRFAAPGHFPWLPRRIGRLDTQTRAFPHA